jgi:hypothetical protein
MRSIRRRWVKVSEVAEWFFSRKGARSGPHTAADMTKYGKHGLVVFSFRIGQDSGPIPPGFMETYKSCRDGYLQNRTHTAGQTRRVLYQPRYDTQTSLIPSTSMIGADHSRRECVRPAGYLDRRSNTRSEFSTLSRHHNQAPSRAVLMDQPGAFSVAPPNPRSRVVRNS